MERPAGSMEKIGRQGQAFQDERIRPGVKAVENSGKHLTLELLSGDYAMAERGVDSLLRLLERRPAGSLYRVRVGHNAPSGFHSGIRRTAAGR